MAKRNENHLVGLLPVVINQLGEIMALDEGVEKQRKRAGILALASGGIGFAVMFCLPPLGAVIWIAMVVFIVQYVKLVRRDLQDDRLEFVFELLKKLQPDVSEKSPIELIIRHGDPFRYGVVSEQRTEGNWMSGKVNYSNHEDTWLVFRGRMADGTTLKLEIGTSGKRKSKPKRKYTKINDRITDEISLAMRVPTDVYPNVERLENVLDFDQLRRYGELVARPVVVQGGIVRVNAESLQRTAFQGRSGRSETGPKLSPRHVVSLLAFVYGGLGGCRKLSV